MSELYRCLSCGWTPKSEEENREYEHCPNCLSAIHEETEDELECGGIMEPVSIWVQPDGKWEIIQRCNFCGEMHTSAKAQWDNPIKLMNIAAKPLGFPPFPVERMEELTKMMGGRGTTEGYYDEQRK